MFCQCFVAVTVFCNNDSKINLLWNRAKTLHDLRVLEGTLSRFKLSLPQCNVPGLLNCMSGRLSGFPSLY